MVHCWPHMQKGVAQYPSTMTWSYSYWTSSNSSFPSDSYWSAWQAKV
jgi:hypothetical protein